MTSPAIVNAAPELQIAIERYVFENLSNSQARQNSFSAQEIGELIRSAMEGVDRELARHRNAPRWLYLRLGTSSWQRHALITGVILPLMRTLLGDDAISQWWWLQKTDILGPCIRLRIQTTANASRNLSGDIGARLANSGLVVSVPVYDPEVRLFGGAPGMNLAHRLFCTDSAFLATWMSRREPRRHAIPEGLSVALVLRLCASAGMDLFECWDLFAQISDKRPFDASKAEPVIALCEQMAGTVLKSGRDGIIGLLQGPDRQDIEEHFSALELLGKELAAGCLRGEITSSCRAFLAPAVLFHWNRVGFCAMTQAAISRGVGRCLGGLIANARGDN
jgi:thiopeptide-type bacteriocin biosynthesis protein